MKNLFHENLAADGGARPVREALFERWRGRFWQVLARAGLADGDAAAPQAAAPRPLTNAADVLQLLEDAPILTDLTRATTPTAMNPQPGSKERSVHRACTPCTEVVL